ncbi:hypothetical protein ACXJY6_06845 [Vibrio sp. RC27]
MSERIEFIFEEPEQFGSRGNDELWIWLKESCTLREARIDSTLKIIDFVKTDLKEFGIDVECRSVSPDELIYIKAFDKERNHSKISIRWWKETGFPLICSRAEYIAGKWETFGDKETSGAINKLIQAGTLKLKP